jgi:GTP-binding protein EngB required for normal cell division
MRDLQEAFDAADLVVRRAEGFVPDAIRRKAAESLDELRSRGARAHSALLLALAGGTGSGKSSVLNAVAGEEVASVGRLRPHTERPLAWIPADGDPAMTAVLDELGISERSMHENLDGVALIDMPDMDSVAIDHRVVVEKLIPRVDGLVWVLDPQKYHDPDLHQNFLAPLSGYASQTTFVLNKIDRLDEADREPVTADVRRLLDDVGYFASRLFPVAAAPPSGDPIGIDALVEFLDDRLDRKRTSYGKLHADLAGIVKDLGSAAGVWKGGSIRLAGRWTVTREAAITALRPASKAPSEDALCRVEDLVAASAAEVGGHIGDRMRNTLDHDVILAAMTHAQHAVSEDDIGRARTLLDDEIGDPLRAMVWERSYFAALVTYAHIGVRQVASRFEVKVT